MTTQTAKPQAIFPDLPRDVPAVDDKGNLTQHWSLGFSQLFQALQTNFSNEGLRLPLLTATQMATITALYTPYIGFPLPQNKSGGTQKFLPDISGAMVFDSTNRAANVFSITYDSSTPPNVSTAGWWLL